MKIEFTVPSYNEEQLLEKNCLELLNFLNSQNYSFDWKIILIINGSTDNSEKIAEKLKEKYFKIDFVVIKEKGKGNAIKKYFSQSSADFLIYMDVDLAVSLENINDLLEPFLKDNYDLISGSRLLPKSKTKRSAIRNLSSKAYILLSKILLNHIFSDLHCGFKGIKKEAWEKIEPLIQDKNWFFDAELLIFSKKMGLKIKEIPVDWEENRYEKRKSKIKLFKDSFIFTKKLIKLRKRLKKEL
jgi:glycosyltransferase involved in cell wall biosynthesis